MERNAGYHTRQKAMIYQYILDNRQRHITATDIASFLATEGTPVGIATIYRYLDKLVDELAKGKPMEKILRTQL